LESDTRIGCRITFIFARIDWKFEGDPRTLNPHKIPPITQPALTKNIELNPIQLEGSPGRLVFKDETIRRSEETLVPVKEETTRGIGGRAQINLLVFYNILIQKTPTVGTQKDKEEKNKQGHKSPGPEQEKILKGTLPRGRTTHGGKQLDRE
jgi:hypothetical protein